MEFPFVVETDGELNRRIAAAAKDGELFEDQRARF